MLLASRASVGSTLIPARTWILVQTTPYRTYASRPDSGATAVNAMESAQTIPRRTHTRAHFLAAHPRTPDVITRWAPGLDDLFVCLKNHFIIGHVFDECPFDPASFYVLITDSLRRR